MQSQKTWNADGKRKNSCTNIIISKKFWWVTLSKIYEKRNRLLKSFSESIKVLKFCSPFFENRTFKKKLFKILFQLWSWSDVDGATWILFSSILDHSFALLIKDEISEWNFLDDFGFTALVEFGSRKIISCNNQQSPITHEKPKDLKCWWENNIFLYNCCFEEWHF